MLVIVWAVALVLLALRLARGTHAVGPRAPGDPRGRGRRAAARQERARLQAAGARDRLGARRQSPGCFYAWQFSFFSPDDFAPLLTFFAWMIVILGGLGRVVGGAGRRARLRLPLRRHALPRLPAALVVRARAERAYLRLIVIGLVIIGLVLFRPQGILGKRDEMVLE